MTSKHHGWQKRWTVDLAAGTATHVSGLVVSFAGGLPQPVNLDALREQLLAKHGPHNLPPMVARWMREAAQALQAARARH